MKSKDRRRAQKGLVSKDGKGETSTWSAGREEQNLRQVGSEGRTSRRIRGIKTFACSSRQGKERNKTLYRDDGGEL